LAGVRAKKVFTNRHLCARFVNKNCHLPSENLPAKLLVNPWRARLSGVGAENHPRDWRGEAHDYLATGCIQRQNAHHFSPPVAKPLGALGLARFFRGAPGLGKPAISA
jgi:hypothetical protein